MVMTVESPGVRLPGIEGKVHGIVGLEPVAVQCDECFRVWRGGTPVVTLGMAIFNARVPGVRLCAECWEKRGWRNTAARGWQQI